MKAALIYPLRPFVFVIPFILPTWANRNYPSPFNAIGAQPETILVRRMVYVRISLSRRLWREVSLGLLIALTIGGAAWIGLWLLDGRGRVAAVVALTILSTSIIATLAPSLSPWVLDRLGVDPAMASGPVATILQDLLSAAIYLGIATYYA